MCKKQEPDILVSDQTQEGWLYLAAILDLYSRGIVGWAMSDSSLGYLSPEAYEQIYYQRHGQSLSVCPQN